MKTEYQTYWSRLMSLPTIFNFQTSNQTWRRLHKLLNVSSFCKYSSLCHFHISLLPFAHIKDPISNTTPLRRWTCECKFPKEWTFESLVIPFRLLPLTFDYIPKVITTKYKWSRRASKKFIGIQNNQRIPNYLQITVCPEWWVIPRHIIHLFLLSQFSNSCK